MIDIFLSFQVNVFINTDGIQPDTSTISKLLELFRDDGFIPNTINEIGPEGPKLRLRMSSPDNKWNISFLSQRINIQCAGSPEQTNNQSRNEMDDFLAKTKGIVQKIFEYLDQRSSRLAFIVHAILKEMTKPELENCYNKLFIPLPTYRENSPFEWNNRSGSREQISLADTTETVNIFTEIKRIRGHMVSGNKLTELERVYLQYELNTTHENKETRFSMEQFEPFLDIAKENYSKIITELEGVLND